MKYITLIFTFILLPCGASFASESTEQTSDPLVSAVQNFQDPSANISIAEAIAQTTLERSKLEKQLNGCQVELQAINASRGQKRVITAKKTHVNRVIDEIKDDLKKLAKHKLSISVLFADDDAILRMTGERKIREICKDMKLHLELTTNGPDALELYKARPYDIVCTDLMMPPGYNGDVLGREIKKIARLRDENVVIILNSAESKLPVFFEAEEDGGKPLFDAIVNKIPAVFASTFSEKVGNLPASRKNSQSSEGSQSRKSSLESASSIFGSRKNSIEPLPDMLAPKDNAPEVATDKE
jgi:CheY-like chemotaxis protein